jgi:hypothetical protein
MECSPGEVKLKSPAIIERVEVSEVREEEDRVHDARELGGDAAEDESKVVKVGADYAGARGGEGNAVQGGDERGDGQGEEEGSQGASLLEASINGDREIGVVKGKDVVGGVKVKVPDGSDKQEGDTQVLEEDPEVGAVEGREGIGVIKAGNGRGGGGGSSLEEVRLDLEEAIEESTAAEAELIGLDELREVTGEDTEDGGGNDLRVSVRERDSAGLRGEAGDAVPIFREVFLLNEGHVGLVEVLREGEASKGVENEGEEDLLDLGSGSGPIGVRDAIRARGTAQVQQILFSLILHTLAGLPLSQDFNEAHMAFIQKKHLPEDGHRISRLPSQTRTISLSNTDSKIVASAILRILTRNLSQFIQPNQFGLRGRTLLDCFFQVESHLLQATASSPSPAVACFDYSNAFPSLDRPYLWILLEHLGVPLLLITAIRNLYLNATHHILALYHSDFTITVDAGLKQGCPLAAFLFSLAISPLIAALHRIALPSPSPSIVRSYLDDLAFVFRRITTQLPRVMHTILLFSDLTNLHSLYYCWRLQLHLPWRALHQPQHWRRCPPYPIPWPLLLHPL